jgi:hypothetical protein
MPSLNARLLHSTVHLSTCCFGHCNKKAERSAEPRVRARFLMVILVPQQKALGFRLISNARKRVRLLALACPSLLRTLLKQTVLIAIREAQRDSGLSMRKLLASHWPFSQNGPSRKCRIGNHNSAFSLESFNVAGLWVCKTRISILIRTISL